MAATLMNNQFLVEHAKRPQFNRLLISPTHETTVKNSSCGDAVIVSLNIIDKVIQDVGFQSIGCMLCKASTSILLTHIKNKKVETVLALTEEDLLGMLEARDISYGRRRCAMLGFEAVRALLAAL